jgi:hypothetical protein
MHEVYGDGSDHKCCDKCGYCAVCGDCELMGCGEKKVCGDEQLGEPTNSVIEQIVKILETRLKTLRYNQTISQDHLITGETAIKEAVEEIRGLIPKIGPSVFDIALDQERKKNMRLMEKMDDLEDHIEWLDKEIRGGCPGGEI